MSHQYYKPAKSRLHRSELAVPGSSPKMFDKALNSNADYIFLDLEDAVSPNDKIQARANVIKALREINWREKGKTISVRINGLDTHYCYRDVVDLIASELESTNKAGREAIKALSEKRNIRRINFEDWQLISEQEFAQAITPRPREMFTRVKDMLAVLEKSA